MGCRVESQARIPIDSLDLATHFCGTSGSSRPIDDADDTLLDNSLVLYGSGISDGNAHNHDDLPIVTFGKAAGAVKPGRHLRYPKDTPLCNLYLSMLDKAGVKIDTFGDSTGRLDRLDT